MQQFIPYIAHFVYNLYRTIFITCIYTIWELKIDTNISMMYYKYRNAYNSEKN